MSKYARKVDANQPAIVEELRGMGYPIKLLSHCPMGCLDFIVGIRGILFWIEVKATEKSPLTAAEKKTFDDFAGYPVIRATSTEEILQKAGVHGSANLTIRNVTSRGHLQGKN